MNLEKDRGRSAWQQAARDSACGLEARPLTFLIVPRMPDTVRIEAPSNLATSSWEVNMPVTKAVWRAILKGVPTSFSFFITLGAASSPSTTPVALILHPCAKFQQVMLSFQGSCHPEQQPGKDQDSSTGHALYASAPLAAMYYFNHETPTQ